MLSCCSLNFVISNIIIVKIVNESKQKLRRNKGKENLDWQKYVVYFRRAKFKRKK